MPHAVCELDVRLRDITPPIWRTIEIAGDATLEDVHYAIQVAMGWNHSHLHQFIIGQRRYGMAAADEFGELEDERSVRLLDLARAGDSILYEYDFGDGWEHTVTVSRVTQVAKPPRPRCTAGARACPPDDCGGPGGYSDLLAALSDPSHPRHAESRTWAGDFEPERFDLPKAGRDLQVKMRELKALAEDHEEEEATSELGLPRSLIDTLLALPPMQRASLVAMLAGSLAQDLETIRAMATSARQTPRSSRSSTTGSRAHRAPRGGQRTRSR